MSPSTPPAGTPIIDIHRHCLVAPFARADGLIRRALRLPAAGASGDTPNTVTARGISSVLYPELADAQGQLHTQDAAGVTRSVLSFSMLLELVCQAVHLPSVEVAKRLNDATAELVGRYPDRLAFMVMVNPFRPASIAECERGLDLLGAHGISIGTSWRGRYLDSPRLQPWWEYVQARGAAVFLHPPMVPIGHRQMNRYKLEEAAGRPFDTALTVARMICSGLFDRYPDVKIVLPHLGGALPNLVGRLDFTHRLGYAGLPLEQAARCQRRPSEYLRTNLFVDTMGFSPAGVRYAIELFGADRVLFGSDFAAVPISPLEHVEMINGLGLAEDDRERILWKNAAGLFGLDCPPAPARSAGSSPRPRPPSAAPTKS